MTTSRPATDRVRLRRRHDRGAYDRPTIDAILDAQPLAHVGYVLDGQPLVTPTLQWREGNEVFWHGSAASRMIEQCIDSPVCVTVTLLDALVLARSAFNHSVNYRSVMLLGRARLVDDPVEKAQRLERFVDSLYPGRWKTLRPMSAQELKATSVLALVIDEASAKCRQGPPKDDDEDLEWPVWAGIVPLRTVADVPEPDPRGPGDQPPPAKPVGFGMM